MILLSSGALRRASGIAGLAAALLSVPASAQETREGYQPLACPTGTTIPGFNAFLISTSDVTKVRATWNAPTGAPAGTVYEVLRTTSYYSDYCSYPSQPSYGVIGTTTSLSFDPPAVPTNVVYGLFVRVQSCAVGSPYNILIDSFTSAPAAPTLSATATATDQATLKYSQPDAKAFSVELERSFNGGAFSSVSGFQSSFQNYCPIGSQKTYVDQGLAPGMYTYRLGNYGDAATDFSPVYSASADVVIGNACTAPGAPTLSTPAGQESGKPLPLSWGAAPNLAQGGSYTAETSRDGFTTIEASGTTSSTSISLPTTASATSYTLSARVRATQSCGTPGPNSNVVSVSLTPGCVAPGAPVLSAPQTLPAGKPLTLSWQAAPNLAAGGSYQVETSKDNFQSVSTVTTMATSAALPTDQSSTNYLISARVRAVQACGIAGPYSATAVITVQSSPASFIITQGGPTWTTPKGEAPAPATVTFKNIGGQPGHLVLSRIGDFFSVSPAALDAAGGEEVSAVVKVNADRLSVLNSPGSYLGSLVGLFGDNVLSTPVSLIVTSSAANTGAKAKASVGSLLFSAPAGQTPGAQTITITVTPPPAGNPLYLVPSIGPGGSWLEPGSEITNPVPASGQMQLTLRVNRAKRSRDDAPPLLRTLLHLTPAGGDPLTDGAVVEVFDLDKLTPGPGAGTRSGTGSRYEPLVPPPPGGTSFIIPTAVKTTSGLTGQLFTSDGWLRNLSGDTVTADFFCTADGKDGLVDPSVAKTTVTVPPGGTFRMSDLMQTVFLANGISANIEVRSSSINALSMRSTVDSQLPGGDPATRFGTEIPTVSFGSGVGLGDDELIVPGIDDDAANRANLILAETSGSAASVRITLRGSDGSLVGTMDTSVPPFSKVQINRVVDAVAHGMTLSGGWVGVSVTSGNGKIVPVATVIDNASGSFSAVLGQGTHFSTPAGRRRALAASPRYLLPAVARTLGAFNTQFITSMSLVNGTAQPVNMNLTYNYIDQDDGGKVKSVTKPLMLPARGSIPKALGSDMIKNFFGVPGRSFGSIQVEGDLNRVTGIASVSAQVDPNDAAKGLKTAQVNGTFLDSPSIGAQGQEERRFAGLEKSFQKRSNLILLEVDGKPVQVMVRLYSSAGEKMAEQVFGVGPNEYRQLTDVFGPGGVNLGDGPFQNVEVTMQVVAGDGRILALASVIDNLSRNPEIFVLTVPAPPGDPTIGF